MDMNLKLAMLSPGLEMAEKAYVPLPSVTAKISKSTKLSCGSGGQPLSFCFWHHHNYRNGGMKVVYHIPYDDVVEHGANSTVKVEGLEFIEVRKFKEGKCRVKIEGFAVGNNVGTWTCILVSESGTMFSGLVDLGELKLKL